MTKDAIEKLDKDEIKGINLMLMFKKESTGMYVWFVINMIIFFLSGDIFILILSVLLLILAIAFTKKASVKVFIPESILIFLLAIANLLSFLGFPTKFIGILGLMLAINQTVAGFRLLRNYKKFKDYKLVDKANLSPIARDIIEIFSHKLTPSKDDNYFQFTTVKTWPSVQKWIGKISGKQVLMYSKTINKFDVTTLDDLDIKWGKKILLSRDTSAKMNVLGKKRQVTIPTIFREKLSLADDK